MEQPANVATPLTAVAVLPPVQVRAAGPPEAGVPVRMLSVTTVALSDVTTLPAASVIRTVGWVVNATPPTTGLGGVVLQTAALPQQSSSLVARPDVTLNVGPMIAGSPPAPSSAVRK